MEAIRKAEPDSPAKSEYSPTKEHIDYATS